MKSQWEKSNLDELVADVIQKKHIYEAVFHVCSDDCSIDIISASGNIGEDSQYYIASINKLFVSSLILRLCTQKKLDLNDKVSKYLPEDIIEGLHVYKGKNYSDSLSIIHLISLTSGLPCYLTDTQANGKKAIDELEAGVDQAWPIDKVIQEIKMMKPHFSPGASGRAKYGDSNHQILSLIIERITGVPINIVLENLFQELNLTKTYVYGDSNNEPFIPIRYKSKEIHLDLFLHSTHNDIISTARDQMAFIKAFFNGYFFPKEQLKELERWNNIFFPFKYGIGIQKFSLPRIFSPFREVPYMIGHSGSVGSVAYYVPDKKIYITGTINQQARPNIAFQTMIKIISKVC